MYLFVVAIMLGACGRIAFDPAGDDAGACASVEGCNGVDDDCDLRVDEGCPCAPFDRSVSTTGVGDHPGFAWLGDSYIAVIRADPDLELHKFPADGGSVVSERLIGMSSGVGRNAVAWSGQTIAVAMDDRAGGIWLARYDRNLVALGSQRVNSPTATIAIYAFVTWTGQHYAIAWSDQSGSGQIYIREYTEAGTPLGPEVPIGLPGMFSWSLETTRIGYLLGARDAVSNSAALFVDGASFASTSHPFNVTGDCGYVHFTRTRTGFAGSCNLTDPAMLLVDDAGVSTSAPIPLPYVGGMALLYPDLASSDMETLLLAAVGRGIPAPMVFAELDATAAVLAGPVTLATQDAGGVIAGPSVLTSAGRVAVLLNYGTPPATIARLIVTCR